MHLQQFDQHYNIGGRKKIKNKYDKQEKNFIKNIFPKMCAPYKYTPAIMEAKHRIIVFGDIHGDYNLAIDMLNKAKLIEFDNNNNILWIGGSTYVVQVGDQIDRCRPVINLPCSNPNATINDENSDIKIMELFNNLNLQATEANGAVISLLGNHELLNTMGIMNYVSYQGIKQFENYVDPDSPNRKFKTGIEARSHAFQPGNTYARMMGCTRMPAVIIGSNLFVHAGIVDGLIKEIELKDINDFEKINIKIKRWLLGLLDQNYVENIVKYSKNSMFWTRLLGKIPPGTSINNPVCADNIKNVLSLFKVGSIIIGHTPQSFMYSDDINSTCDNKIWRVDNGSSSAFNAFDAYYKTNGVYVNSRRTQYLEIIDDINYYVCDGITCKKEIRYNK